jgi:hypothetical protein
MNQLRDCLVQTTPDKPTLDIYRARKLFVFLILNPATATGSGKRVSTVGVGLPRESDQRYWYTNSTSLATTQLPWYWKQQGVRHKRVHERQLRIVRKR